MVITYISTIHIVPVRKTKLRYNAKDESSWVTKLARLVDPLGRLF